MNPVAMAKSMPVRMNVFGMKDVLAPALTGWIFAVLIIAAGFDVTNIQSPLDTDDSMRLVQVRDLINGQSWFDTTQTRLGLEGGTSMHWSRLVDAPIAAIVLALRWLIGQPNAEIAAMILWPALLIGPVMLAMASMAHLVGGRPAAYLACLICAAAVQFFAKFSPGALDHHNVQIALFLVAMSGTALLSHGAKYGALAGASVAVSIAVGIEFFPQMAFICIAVAVFWAWRGSSLRAAALAFSLALGIATILLFVATASPEAYRGGFCDAFSRDLAIPAVVGAAGLAILSQTLSNISKANRFIALGLLLIALSILTLFLAPACLSHPYSALDPVIRERFLPYVRETRPLYRLAIDRPWGWGVVLLGIASPLAFYLGLRSKMRGIWFFFAAMIALCFAMAAYQIRWVPAFAIVAVLPSAVLCSNLYSYARKNARMAPSLAGIALATFAVPHVWLAVDIIAPREIDDSESFAANIGFCLREGSVDTLAALSPGLVLAGPNLGPHILRYTSHRVLSAPYHRNVEGWIAQNEILLSDDAEAERRLRELGVDYVVSCPRDPGVIRSLESSNFAANLRLGKVPLFLERVGDGDSGLIDVYRILPIK